MLPFLRDHHGDPGRLHAEGRATRVPLEVAREQVASFVGARPREVVFTSSGTEAVNAAVWGAIARARDAAPGRAVHVVASAVEHSAVLEACGRDTSVELTVVGVDALGRVDPADVLAALRDDTALVNVQTANHEVGTVQPVAEIVEACRSRGTLVHVDACASVGSLPLAFVALGAHLCSITAHKMGGPKGVGALLVRRGLRLPPLILGGAQERARRGGVENVAAAVGFGAVAAELASGVLDREAAALRALTERVIDAAPSMAPGVHLYGDPVDRLPGLVCLAVAGVEAEPIVLGLDRLGIAVHSGSSCSSESFEPSPVLAAMGVDAQHSLRVSGGWSSTEADIDALLDALPQVIAKLRALRGARRQATR